MALGGGTWTAYNKTLAGIYINVVSTAAQEAETENGVVAIPMALGWGAEGAVTVIKAKEFKANPYLYIADSYESDTALPFREMFRGANKILCYRVAGTSSVKASGTVGTAKYAGVGGNNISVVVSKDVDGTTKFVVKTYVSGYLADEQTVAAMSGLIANDFVDWKTSATLSAGTFAFTGGANGTVAGTAYTACETAFEKYTFNILACTLSDSTTVGSLAAYVERMRESKGVTYQFVCYNYPSADSEAVVSVKNAVSDGAGELVYWVAGKMAGAVTGDSLTGEAYDGEYEVTANYTQSQLESAVKAGEFVFHEINETVRVLMDINTLVTVSDSKNKYFKENAVIRTLDRISYDLGVLFAETIMGQVQNTIDGRDALRLNIYNVLTEYSAARAIESVNSEEIIVTSVDKNAVEVSFPVTVIGTIDQIYMTITVS